MSTINEAALTTLGNKLAHDALRLFVACNPHLRTTHLVDLDVPLDAMRAASKVAIDRLLDDTNAQPVYAELFFAAAVATVAEAGTAALRAAQKEVAA